MMIITPPTKARAHSDGGKGKGGEVMCAWYMIVPQIWWSLWLCAWALSLTRMPSGHPRGQELCASDGGLCWLVLDRERERERSEMGEKDGNLAS